MPNPTAARSWLLVAVALAASVAAQQAPATIAIDDTTALQALPDRLVAVGRDYVATFTAQQVEFQPALGARAPHDLPLRLRVVGVSRGERPAAVDLAAAPRALGARTVEYARGAARERFAVAGGHVHWTWHFDRAPAGNGDLVVRCALDTELRPEPLSGGGLRLAWPGVGGVDVGGVTGIDARGRSAAGELRIGAGQLELVLPARFVDAAAFPLVLDPVINTFTIDAAGTNGGSDAAYDAGTDRWLVVWHRAISATSTLVHGRLLLGDGTPTGAVFQALPVANRHQQNPTVASMRSAGAFLVCWQESTGSTAAAPWRLRGTIVDAVAGPTTLPFVLGSLIPGPSEETPRACSDNDTDGSHDVQIVWTAAGTGIRGTKFHLDPLGTYSTVLTTLSTDATDERPVISRSQRADAAHLVAWRRSSGVGPAVHGAMFSRVFGAVGIARALTTAVAGTDVTSFDVDGDGARFGLTWRAAPTGGTPAVMARPVDWNGALLTPGAEQWIALQPIGGSIGASFLGRFGPKLLAAWSSRGFLSLAGSVHGRDLSPDCLLCPAGWSLTQYTSPARFASRIAGGGTTPDGLLLHFLANGAGNEVRAARVSAFAGTGTITPVGSGCGTAGTIGATGGPFALGNPDFGFQLSGAPAGTVPFLSLGFPGGEIGCGSCVLTNAIAFEFRPAVGGGASYSWALPCDAAFLGVNFSAQWVLFLGAGAPCPAAPGLVSTNRLELTLGQ